LTLSSLKKELFTAQTYFFDHSKVRLSRMVTEKNLIRAESPFPSFSEISSFSVDNVTFWA
jgi:hypothetical protein